MNSNRAAGVEENQEKKVWWEARKKCFKEEKAQSVRCCKETKTIEFGT